MELISKAPSNSALISQAPSKCTNLEEIGARIEKAKLYVVMLLKAAYLEYITDVKGKQKPATFLTFIQGRMAVAEEMLNMGIGTSANSASANGAPGSTAMVISP